MPHECTSDDLNCNIFRRRWPAHADEKDACAISDQAAGRCAVNTVHKYSDTHLNRAVDSNTVAQVQRSTSESSNRREHCAQVQRYHI